MVGHFAFTPGGTNFLFGRLVQAGVVDRYLEQNCPDPTIGLCLYRNEIPSEGDQWLWNSEVSPLYQLGDWDGFEPEAGRIIRESLVQQPLMHVMAMLRGSFEQFFMLETGEQITQFTFHTRDVLAEFAPRTLAAYFGARQQLGPINFFWLNVMHVPVALAALAALLLRLLSSGKFPLGPLRTEMVAFVMLALIANAVVFGAFSNPHHRYQSRLAPLGVLVLIILAFKRELVPPGLTLRLPSIAK